MRYNNKKNTAKELSQYFAKFISEKEGDRSPKTLEGYKMAMQLFADYLQNVKHLSINQFGIDSFTYENADGFVKWLKDERGDSPGTCNIRLGQLTAFLGHFRKKNPEYSACYHEFKDFERLKAKQPEKEEPMSREAVSAIIETAGKKSGVGFRYSTMFRMLYETAGRIDELLSIRLCNLHLDVAKPYVKYVGKGKKERALYLPKKLVTNLKRFIQIEHGINPNPGAYLFFSRSKGLFDKMTRNAFSKQLTVYVELARQKCSLVPEKVHPHLFRRSRATHWIESGMTIYQVSKLLGHEDVKTTVRYLSFTLTMKDDAIKRIESDSAKNSVPKWKSDASLRDIFK